MWALVFVALPAARAQGRGVVEGKLVNGTDPSIIAAGVDLDVIGLGGGMSILKSIASDSGGRFRVEGLPTDSPTLIRANYHSANYNAPVNFDSSGKAYVEIRIFETTTSFKGIEVDTVRMAFQLTGERLRALESYSFRNETAPPRTFMSSDGNFRFSKAPGILELPQLSATGPGATMPLMQNPLETPDGQSYYSLYPLRPGVTSFEVEQSLPYNNRSYVYRKKFYQDVGSFQIGVIPQDMALSGEGLSKGQVDSQQNFAIYSGGPVKAGTEVTWTFSGGTPLPEPTATESGGESKIEPVPTMVGQNSMIIAPLLLMGFIVILWYATNRAPATAPGSQDPRIKALKDRREQLLTLLATLDSRYEAQGLDRREYFRQREHGKRQLRRIFMLLGKK